MESKALEKSIYATSVERPALMESNQLWVDSNGSEDTVARRQSAKVCSCCHDVATLDQLLNPEWHWLWFKQLLLYYMEKTANIGVTLIFHIYIYLLGMTLRKLLKPDLLYLCNHDIVRMHENTTDSLIAS